MALHPPRSNDQDDIDRDAGIIRNTPFSQFGNQPQRGGDAEGVDVIRGSGFGRAGAGGRVRRPGGRVRRRRGVRAIRSVVKNLLRSAIPRPGGREKEKPGSKFSSTSFDFGPPPKGTFTPRKGTFTTPKRTFTDPPGTFVDKPSRRFSVF